MMFYSDVRIQFKYMGNNIVQYTLLVFILVLRPVSTGLVEQYLYQHSLI